MQWDGEDGSNLDAAQVRQEAEAAARQEREKRDEERRRRKIEK